MRASTKPFRLAASSLPLLAGVELPSSGTPAVTAPELALRADKTGGGL